MTWRVAESLNVLLGQLNGAYPNRSKASDGSIGDAAHASRASDHNPWYEVNGQPVVTARDYTNDPAHGVDIARLANELVSSRDARIKYVIANARIADSRPVTRNVGGRMLTYAPWTWLAYTGENQHRHHLHLSVVASPACDDPRPWNLPMLTGRPVSGAATQGDDDMTPEQATQLAEIHDRQIGYGTRIEVIQEQLIPGYGARIEHTEAIVAGLQAAVETLAGAVAGQHGVDPAALKAAVADAIRENVVHVQVDVTAPKGS